MNKQTYKKIHRTMRHNRVRARISGTKERPRVTVFKSNRNVFVQFIDDESGKTIVSSVLKQEVKSVKGNKTEKASSVGELVGKKAIAKGVKTAVFDKGGFKYHGRIKAVADGLRKAGIKI